MNPTAQLTGYTPTGTLCQSVLIHGLSGLMQPLTRAVRGLQRACPFHPARYQRPVGRKCSLETIHQCAQV